MQRLFTVLSVINFTWVRSQELPMLNTNSVYKGINLNYAANMIQMGLLSPSKLLMQKPNSWKGSSQRPERNHWPECPTVTAHRTITPEVLHLPYKFEHHSNFILPYQKRKPSHSVFMPHYPKIKTYSVANKVSPSNTVQVEVILPMPSIPFSGSAELDCFSLSFPTCIFLFYYHSPWDTKDFH